jgi:hypothetical protein
MPSLIVTLPVHGVPPFELLLLIVTMPEPSLIRLPEPLMSALKLVAPVPWTLRSLPFVVIAPFRQRVLNE